MLHPHAEVSSLPGGTLRLLVGLSLSLLAALPIGSSAQVLFTEESESLGLRFSGGEFSSVAWADYDGDGWEDLWLGEHDFRSGHPLSQSQLYRNQSGRGFLDVWPSIHADVSRTDGHGASWIDFDNDGDQDLIIVAGGMAGRGASGAPNLFYENVDGVLHERGELLNIDNAVGRGRFGAWFDIDRDGVLEFAQVNASRNDDLGRNVVLGSGQGRVFDVQAEGVRWRRKYGGDQLLIAGIGHAEAAKLKEIISPVQPEEARGPDFPAPLNLYLANREVVAADFNGDGHTDLFVPPPVYAPDEICHVPARAGSSIAIVLPLADDETALEALRFRFDGSASLSMKKKVENKSDMRVYLGRDSKERTFKSLPLSDKNPSARGRPRSLPEGPGLQISYRAGANVWKLDVLGKWSRSYLLWLDPLAPKTEVGHKLPRCASGDEQSAQLFLWTAEGFEDVSASWDLGPRGSCHSALAGDFDNDADVDLALMCGTIIEDLPDRILWNESGRNFSVSPLDTNLFSLAPGFQAFTLIPSAQVALADFDNDGFLDIFQAPGILYSGFGRRVGSPMKLLRNAGNDNNWLQMKLVGNRSNRDGVGARVLVEAGGIRQLREADGGQADFSQNSKRLHFGLGQSEVVEKISIYWDSGTQQELSNVAVNQVIAVEEPD